MKKKVARAAQTGSDKPRLSRVRARADCAFPTSPPPNADWRISQYDRYRAAICSSRMRIIPSGVWKAGSVTRCPLSKNAGVPVMP